MDGLGATAADNSAKNQPKALRFVTNYGAPHPKRRRIGAACLTCRKRKTACSGERPYCETCKQNKLDCAGYSSETAAPSQGHKRAPSSNSGPPRGETWDEEPARRQPQSPATRPKQEQHEEIYRTTRSSPPRNERREDPPPSTSASRDHVDGTQEPLFSGPRNRMPYFRWLGPTAIMPGFKQMVVKVKRSDADVARSSNDGGMRSPSLNNLNPSLQAPSLYGNTPAAMEGDVRTPLNLPFYDTSPMPPSELITHLANTFFTHLGCNYPFLQRDRFLRDLQEKHVDAILVDAVCALAARFSTHPLLKQQPNDENKLTPAEYGHAFAVRAKTAMVDTFPCPSVAAVQAALLLAYNEFGESRDSGLWMYLGISIRMAQDLGMHKLEGLRYKGRTGPTPKMVKRESLKTYNPSDTATRTTASSADASDKENGHLSSDKEGDEEDEKTVSEQKAVEQERVDTFWAVFFLDRVVSSGTGRRSTLRDKDIELSFPAMSEGEGKSGWPAPFPALIRIVHLYGRVADLLNSVKEPSDITPDTPKRLAAMESQVTQFYQGLSPRLHFDAVNFQHYMKAGEGTNFVLLHFWFHTLIVLLHQPTLLKTFEGRMLQLFPNSQQLSMSSAKTIADILSYSQLMDAKASLGNPFTSQPIYIAACAFLRETAEQTASSNAQSRASSPGPKDASAAEAASSTSATPAAAQRPGTTDSSNGKKTTPTAAEHKAMSKHTLLATAASQHYQLCYKALQSLETYWAGAKYILTVLNQKFEGVGDPLLYTVEEGESAMERPRPEPAFTSPGWRRKFSLGAYGGALGMHSPFLGSKGLGQVPGSPGGDPSRAIGWTLTGTMNSPSTNLAWHYPSGMAEPSRGPDGGSTATTDLNGSNAKPRYDRAAGSDVGYGGLPALLGMAGASSRLPPSFPASSEPSASHVTSVSASDAGLLLGLNSGYATQVDDSRALRDDLTTFAQEGPYSTSERHHASMALEGHFNGAGNMQDFGDMTIESQDVDMSMLGLDMMPWFDSTYGTPDVMHMFGAGGHHNGHGHQGHGDQAPLG